MVEMIRAAICMIQFCILLFFLIFRILCQYSLLFSLVIKMLILFTALFFDGLVLVDDSVHPLPVYLSILIIYTISSTNPNIYRLIFALRICIVKYQINGRYTFQFIGITFEI